ncbi:MAG TPA: hypothetical protein DHV50_10570, partial [Erythrobacter sp.]|nr:hypothetical protein [Erythrobacter sp.]
MEVDMSEDPRIEMLATGDLIPYAKNSRTHSPQQVAQIAASIREFGFTNPVLVADDLTIIAGHGRVQAAQSLGMDAVPCLKLSHLDERQRKAYVIADNRLALNAGWDDDMLAIELAALREDGFDLDLLGFDEAEIAGLLDNGPGEQVEPEPDTVPSRVTLGDVWRVGDQWFVCGDSSDRAVVDLALSGREVGALLFDPEFHADFSAWDLHQYEANDVFVFGDCVNRTHERADVPGEWKFQLVWDGVTRHIVKGMPMISHKTCDWYSADPAYDQDGWFDPRDGAQSAQKWTNAKGSVEMKGSARG